MKLDLSRVLELIGEADVVTADVDLTSTQLYGQHIFHDPIHMKVEAVNRAGVVSLNCTYDYTIFAQCDRCLTQFEIPSHRTMEHTVVTAVIGDDDESYLIADHGCLELDELATNDVLAEIPTRFLCHEDCKGLCTICGCNRNDHECQCEVKHVDPRLTALQQLLEE